MRKLRLYLDISVISNIDAPHVPDKEAITKQFFRIASQHPDEYELVISTVTDQELEMSPEPKRTLFKAFLRRVEHRLLSPNGEAEQLAQAYLSAGVLGEKHFDDLLHIAYAVISRCDYIISWNMHFVRARTISLVNMVNENNNYHCIIIATPIIVAGEIENEDA